MTITELIIVFILKELEAKKRDYKDLQKEAAFFKSQILMRDELIEVRYEYPFWRIWYNHLFTELSGHYIKIYVLNFIYVVSQNSE